MLSPCAMRSGCRLTAVRASVTLEPAMRYGATLKVRVRGGGEVEGEGEREGEG